jgi:ribonucleoside-diphosphate reductase alpha chain
LTSHDVDPIDHVKMQVAFQNHVNNAVSKTVNLRREATIKDIEDVYMTAYELGAKGVTIYRDGSKDQQILNLSEKKTSQESVEKTEKSDKSRQEATISQAQQAFALVELRKRKDYFGTNSTYYEVDTGYGPLHVHVNYDEYGPLQLFANISPVGTEISGLTTALGILISKYLELGGDPRNLLKHLNSIKGDRPMGLGQRRIDSIPHALSKVLRDHLVKTGIVQDLTSQTKLVVTGQKMEIKKTPEPTLYCPKCFSPNVEILAGCSKPTCFDCGYSECG